MISDETLICSYLLNRQGGGRPIVLEDAEKVTPDDGLLWLHWNWRQPATRVWLEEKSGIEPLVVEALLAEDTRPRVTQYPNGLLVILRGVNHNANANPEDMLSLRIWIEKNRIISTKRLSLLAITDLEAVIQQGLGPQTAGEFAVMVANLMIDRMDPVVGGLMDEIDDLEVQMLQSPTYDKRSDIIGLRRQLIILRRYIAPQRDVMSQLNLITADWFSLDDRNYLRENQDRLTRYVEDLDSGRDRCTIVQEEISNMIAETTNRNMYVLSVVAAIFLPLGFLTGLLGINVGGIPGSENPMAFWVFSGMLLSLTIVGIVWLKFQKWL